LSDLDLEAHIMCINALYQITDVKLLDIKNAQMSILNCQVYLTFLKQDGLLNKNMYGFIGHVEKRSITLIVYCLRVIVQCVH
jgi:hypothetical protein